MIKAVLFDYGGVITPGGRPGELSNNLATNLEIPNERAEKLLSYGFDKIKRGLIDLPEFWRVLETAYGEKISEEKRNIWCRWEDIRPLPEMLAFRASLEQHGLVTGILSNVEPTVMSALREHGAYDGFSPLILSCETGYAKPDPEIYELALRQLGIGAGECVFIDDQERMLVPARELGMHTVLAVSTDRIIRDVNTLLDAATLN